MLTITEIEAIPVRLDIRPLSEPLGIAPYVTTYTEFYDMERVLIRLDTDGDITGWGEMRSTLSTNSTKAVIETDIADKLAGEPVSAVESLPERFDSFQYFDIDPFLGGVEMAMWDAWGQYLEQPSIGSSVGRSARRSMSRFVSAYLNPRSPAITPVRLSNTGSTCSRPRQAATGDRTSSASWLCTTRSTAN